MIHAGSLIHDDLPAMDNEKITVGAIDQPKRIGEDLAICLGMRFRPFGLIAASAFLMRSKVCMILELSDALLVVEW